MRLCTECVMSRTTLAVMSAVAMSALFATSVTLIARAPDASAARGGGEFRATDAALRSGEFRVTDAALRSFALVGRPGVGVGRPGVGWAGRWRGGVGVRRAG